MRKLTTFRRLASRGLTSIGVASVLLLSAAAGNASAAYRSDNGYYNNSGYNRYSRTVRCDSRNQRTVYCGVDTRGGVTLVRQDSQNSCIRGRTWGTNSRGIWVTRGCRGTFAVSDARYRGDYGNNYYDRGGYANNNYGRNGYGNAGRVVRCESLDSRTRACMMDTRYGVSLVRQRSESPCIQGSTWGVSGNRVWVSNGCRADFATGNSRIGYSPGYDGRY